MARLSIPFRAALLLSAFALLLAACGDDDAPADATRGSLTVGSVDFDENVIVAAIYAEVLEGAGYEVERRFQLGTREAVLPALENGELDVIPDYLGSAVEFIDTGATGDTDETAELLRDLLADRGIAVLEPSSAENKNALVVTQETADAYDLATTSDLADHPGEFVLGGPPECPERPLCLVGFEDTYGIEFASFEPKDADGPATIGALAEGDIDVALLFSTNQAIVENGWVLLDDDENLQPAENIVPLVREESLDDDLRDALNAVSAALTTEGITELNRQVRNEGADPADVAADWVADQGLTP